MDGRGVGEGGLTKGEGGKWKDGIVVGVELLGLKAVRERLEGVDVGFEMDATVARGQLRRGEVE